MPKAKKKTDDAPARKSFYTLKLEPEQMEKLHSILDARDWESYAVDHAAFAYKGPSVNIVAYKSRKLVIQGKGTEDFVTMSLEAEVTGDPRLGYDEVHHPEWFEHHAGMDESGKGDVFGPLVVACVIAEPKAIRSWIEAGVQDSKKVTDATISKLAKIIKNTPGAVVESMKLGMPKYNELMAKPKANLNLLLAWQHAKAIEAALDRQFVPWGMLDQFSKQPLVERYLKSHPDFDLRMMTKAEADPVVAAASIIARDLYVKQMEALSEIAGEPLLKGASSAVKQQATRIFENQGKSGLQSVAKMHFKTVYEAQGLEPPKKTYVRR
ncbi:MAG: ribonuclease HIII [Opitutales bacterium]|nr:ribonuclease HIII [Opitutales bacterium]NRA28567.1 ribonuclease HIII [Opitutales bacterium]